ncbi:hypothetical protein AGMMS50230_07000 [Spirochaetia bacterium]|nr:hypothetical protein AGMMS50230_07000 [Spirochaetia bacterium]
MIIGSQKVVAVDNDFGEIAPLLQALGKRGIPCLWLDGSMDNLPEKPFSGVRILFLDIELETAGSSDATMASAVFARVERIIGKSTSPYFIVFWTKHEKVIDLVLGNLKSVGIEPIDHLNFEKIESLASDDAIEDLLKKIDSKLTDIGAFSYLLEWENHLEKTVSDFSDNFLSDIVSTGNLAEWSAKVVSLLGNLSLSYTGERSLSNSDEDLRNAFLLLSDSFSDSVQNSIKLKTFSYSMPLTNTPLTLEQVAKMNSSLFFDFYPNKKVEFGNVYIMCPPDIHLREALCKNIFPDGDIPAETKVCGIIITPPCDMAHKKYLHNSKHCFRVLYGLIIPILDLQQVENSLKPAWLEKKKQALITELQSKGISKNFIDTVNSFFQKVTPKDSLCKIEPFWYDQKQQPCILIFHFGSLSSVWWDDTMIPPFAFAIKDHLAFDIQSKIANHANRLGNAMISAK